MTETKIGGYKPSSKRLLNFELLRIICMLLIILHHLSCHGVYGQTNFYFNKILKNIFICGGKLGVNVFVLISGYFLIDGKFKFKKALKVWFDVLFYTVGIYLLSTVFKINEVGYGRLLLCFTPFARSEYWFFSCYLIMYVLSPLLNKLIKNLNQREHLILMLALYLLAKHTLLSDTAWFIFLYVVASYIKLYPNKFFESKKFNSLIFLVVTFIVLGANLCGLEWWALKTNENLVWSLSMFLMFKNMKITRGGKVITTLASSTYGIYLIHDSQYLRNSLWNKWLKVGVHYQMSTYFIFSLVSVFMVFVVCFLIDYIKRITVDKAFYWCMDKIERAVAKNKTNEGLKQELEKQNINDEKV